MVLTGCATFQPVYYCSSSANAAAAKDAMPSGSQVSVPTATSGPDEQRDKKGSEAIMCRGAGPIQLANDQSYEDYIHDALVNELKIAGVYSDQGGKPIQIKLTKIDFSFGLTDAEWDMVAEVSVGTDSAITVAEKYLFSSSFFGGVACDDTAAAFMPAVQDLLKKILTNDQLNASMAKPL